MASELTGQILLDILSGVSCKQKVYCVPDTGSEYRRVEKSAGSCVAQWVDLTTDRITVAIGQWRRSLNACAKAQGGIISFALNLTLWPIY